MKSLQHQAAIKASSIATGAQKQFSSAEDAKDRRRFLARARTLPAMMRTNGLGQTVAFLTKGAVDRAEGPEAKLLCGLTEWLVDEKKVFDAPSGGYPHRLLDQVIACEEQRTFVIAMRHANDLAEWLKRFAEIEFADLEEPSASEQNGQSPPENDNQ